MSAKESVSTLKQEPKEPQGQMGQMDSVYKYKQLGRLGEGTYGVVYKATVNDLDFVALKKLRIESDSDGFPISAQREISILKRLDHQNIVKVENVVVGRKLTDIYLVMEYCSYDLAYLMDNVISKGKGYNVSQVKCLMNQLLEGIYYLHSKFIIHRDLKLSNLLLTNDGILKIADFGLARHFAKPFTKMTPNVVTLWYRSPELILGSDDYSTAVDIWSAGCIFGEFLLSTPLLPGETETHQLLLIHDLLGSPDSKIWTEMSSLPFAHLFTFKVKDHDFDKRFSLCSDACKRLITRLLRWSPEYRPTALDALEASFFKESPGACSPIFLCMPSTRIQSSDSEYNSSFDCSGGDEFASRRGREEWDKREMEIRRRERLASIVHEASQMDLRDFDRPDWNTFYIPENPSLKSSIQKILLEFFFRPLINQFSDYCWSDFTLDFLAAITNVCTLIPSAISYASTLAFASNRAGLTSCAIPPIIYTLFGTSRHLSIGPSVLTSIITGSIIQSTMRNSDMSANMLHRNLSFYTGIVCIVLSLFQAGFLDNIISGYLLSGFISCIAIMLITNQIPLIFGIPIQLSADEPIYMKIYNISINLFNVNGYALALGFGSIIFLFCSHYLIAFLTRKGYDWVHRIPIVFILILLTSILSFALDLKSSGIQHLDTTSDIQLNDPSLIFLSHSRHLEMIKSVLLLTIVGYVEMQSVSRANSLETGHTVNGNREFFAVGMSNLINSFFGGYVTFASTTRSRTLLINGSKTKMVNLISGILSVIIVYTLHKSLQYVPRPVLGAIVIKSACVLFPAQDVAFIFKVRAWEDLSLFLMSFLITFCTSIFEGIIFSLTIAVLVIIKKVSFVSLSILGRSKDRTPGGTVGLDYVDIKDHPNSEIIAGLMIVSVKGPFLFYNCSSFPYILKQLMKEDSKLNSDMEKDLDIAGSSQTMDNAGLDESSDHSESNFTTRSQRLLERVVQEVRRLENIASANGNNHPYILIIDFSKCAEIDTSALLVLIHVIRSEKSYDTRVIFTGIHDNHRHKFLKASITDMVKEENFFSTVDEAIESIQSRS